jgi:hypothetical protein
LRDELPQRIKQKIDTEKCLVSILWLVNGIHTLLNVQKWTAYNTVFFTDAVTPSLIENFRSGARRKRLKVWLIHMDNARPHNSGQAQRGIEVSRVERLLHPAYSPDPTPSDFFLFGYEHIKGKLSGHNCESQEGLFNAITKIFAGVEQEVMRSIFESWVTRLK